MNTESKTAKNLTAGDLIRVDGVVIREVSSTHDYGNGWWVVYLTTGEGIDCLAYRTFTLA